MADRGAPEYLSVSETARRLGVHENTVRNWVRRGVLRSARVPGSRFNRFEAAEVERVARSRGKIVTSIDEGRLVVGPELVDATQLSAFADRLEARGLLPRLVRRLLAASEGVQDLSMPAGEGIASSGWDGRANASIGSPWVPPGQSAWELSTARNPRAKAQADYEKRTAEVPAADRLQTTFVFVTPRRWRDARKWEAEHRQEESWRDVRVLDADDLEGWLEASAAVHYWISEQLGTQPRGAQTLSAWWHDFTRRTRPQLPPGLFLAGREQAASDLRDHLGGPASAIGIQATWRYDALGFLGALFEGDESGPGLDRPPLMVSSPRVWDRLVESDAPMVLIPTFDTPDVATAVGHKHHVIVPLGAEEVARGVVIELDRPSHDGVREAFLAGDLVSFDEAYRLAGLARRSMASLVRELSVDPAILKPQWAQRPRSDIMTPLMLIGAWAETDADHRVVTELVGQDWASIERELVAQSTTEDPPFTQSGGQWHLTSPEEAFVILQPLLTPRLLERWQQTVGEVLAETDPSADLPDSERLFSGRKPGGRAHSPALRQGLSQSLAVVASFGNRTVGANKKVARYAEEVVAHLLKRANDDPKGLLWRSVSPLLPRFAEAAPDFFLDAVEVGTTGQTPLLATMFRDSKENTWLSSSSPHTGLLWALETLCWSPEYLERAAAMLARLVEIDPGGKLANRPAASLRAVFLPWVPYTAASVGERLDILKRLRARHSQVMWTLLVSVLPQHQDFSSPTSRPRFRAWLPAREGASVGDYAAAVAGLVEQVREAAGNDPARWAELVGHLNALSPEHRSELLDALSELSADPEVLEPEARLKLWRRLTEEAARHRAFQSADWAMDDTVLNRLERLAEKVEPPAAVERHSWLFDWHPTIPGVDMSDYGSYTDALEQKRTEVVRETLAVAGYNGLLRLARESAVPSVIGQILAQISGDHAAQEMFDWLAGDELHQQLASTWITTRAIADGSEWITSAWSRVTSAGSDAQLLFLLSLPVEDQQRTLASADQPVQDEFWRRIQPWAFTQTDPTFAVEQFTRYGRPWDAIKLLTGHMHGERGVAPSVTAELVQGALAAALKAESLQGANPHSLGYEIGVLLDFLETSGVSTQELAATELQYFPVFNNHREPKALYAALGGDPTLFVELVSLAFRGEQEPRRKVDEAAEARARRAWEVLRGWRRIPGFRDGEAIDAAHLERWVKQARLLLAEGGRADIGDELIGEMLSGSPSGEDGVWPAEPVRDLIETIGSKEIDSGLHIGRSNARGFTSRGVFDGGQQERELAAGYRDDATKIATQWPRTARVLRGLAESYEREASEHDTDAERYADEA